MNGFIGICWKTWKQQLQDKHTDIKGLPETT